MKQIPHNDLLFVEVPEGIRKFSVSQVPGFGHGLSYQEHFGYDIYHPLPPGKWQILGRVKEIESNSDLAIGLLGNLSVDLSIPHHLKAYESLLKNLGITPHWLVLRKEEGCGL